MIKQNDKRTVLAPWPYNPTGRFLNRYSRYLFFTVLFFLGCNPFDHREDNVGLVVGTTQISPDRLKKDMAYICAGLEVQPEQQVLVRDQLLEQCINHYLVLEYAKENSIVISEEEQQRTLKELKRGYSEDAFKEAILRGYVNFEQWKERFSEQLLVMKVKEKVSQEIPQPSYEEIKQFYEKNLDSFKTPKMLEFRQILSKTQEEADTILKRLQNGENMAELAAKYSTAPEAGEGGKVGWVAEANLNKIMAEALFSLQPGKLSPVVKTPFGYHIFEVLTIRPEGMIELPDAIDEIKIRLFQTNREKFLKKWLEKLKNDFSVKINREMINSMEFFR